MIVDERKSIVMLVVWKEILRHCVSELWRVVYFRNESEREQPAADHVKNNQMTGERRSQVSPD
jgi:hypothetical protein